MKGPDNKPRVRLVGRDGNAFAIMGRVKQALQKEGADQEYIDKFIEECVAGDYDNLLRTVMEYADVY